jgi:hypothetical protein
MFGYVNMFSFLVVCTQLTCDKVMFTLLCVHYVEKNDEKISVYIYIYIYQHSSYAFFFGYEFLLICVLII